VPATLVPGVKLAFLKVSNQLAKFDLAIEFSDTPAGISGFVEYRTDLFDAETIERLLADLESILRTVTQNPDVALSSIELAVRPTASAAATATAEAAPAAEAPATAAEAAPDSAAAKPKGLKDVRRKAVTFDPER
jgi:non-ribosomal peptide synthetase component F